MRFKEFPEDGIDVFLLEGELDLHYAPVLRSLLQAKVCAACPALVIDLSAVPFIDSTGLAAIIEYFRDSGEYRGLLCLVGLNKTLRMIFEIVRLDTVIPIFAARADAIAAVKAGTIAPPESAIFGRPAAA
jgi:anti-sigma B factor antagonist